MIADAFNSRGVDLLTVFARHGSLVCWRGGVWLVRLALRVTRDEGERRRYLGNLGEALRMRYERDGGMAYLDGAIEAGRRAVLGVGAGVGAQAGAVQDAKRLAGLGVALRLRFEESSENGGEVGDAGGGGDDLTEAEKYCRLAVECVADEDPFRVEAERALGDALVTRYESYRSVESLDEAISVYRHASGDGERGQALSALAVALRMRYDRFGGGEVLAEAIRCAERAAEKAEDPGERALCLEDLAQCLDSRYESTRELEDAAAAVRGHRAAVELVPARHSERFVLEANLGRALRAYGLHKGDVASVLEAVALRRGALAVAAGRGRHGGVIESELGMDLVACFELTGEESALDEALGYARRAVEEARGTPHEAAAQTDLGHILRTLYDRRSEDGYFAEGLRACRAAVDLTSDDDESRPEYLSNLSNVLLSGFEGTGDRERLAEAIGLARTAAYDDGPARTADSDLYSNLGNLLAILYENTGDLDTLREAVEVCRTSLALASGRPADLPGKLSNLGRVMLVLHERTLESGDLEAAVAACRQAVATCRDDDPDLPLFLHGLGNALFTHFEEVSSVEDLREAVGAYRRAAELCPADHRDWPMHMASLGMGLLGANEHSGMEGGFDESITVLRSAVEGAVASDPERAKYLNNLGLALTARGAAGDAVEAGRVFRAAAQSAVAATSVRIRAGREWGLVAGNAGSWQEAAEAFELCVELLPRIAGPSLNRLDQEHHLTLFPDLSTEAAVGALEAGSPERALMLLERARGVLVAQALRMRPDLAAVEAAAPELAKRLEELRIALDGGGGAGSGGVGGGLGEGSARPDSRRYESRAAMEEELLEVGERIRALPGLKGVLKAPTVEGLLEQAQWGPIVFLNTHERRSDALMVAGQRVWSKRLPLLTPDSAASMQTRFTAALAVVSGEETSAQERQQAEVTVQEVLGELWVAVAEPVLSELGFVRSGEERLEHRESAARLPRLPRMWWVSTGPLAALPLHAAGNHGVGETAGLSVLDCVVSSYTPTIDALRHAREGSGAGRNPRVLAVGMTQTAGQDDLPSAAPEVEAVRERFADACTVLKDGEATWERVYGLLSTHSWVHFACHGVGDLAEPSASRLLLADHLVRPLTVSDVSRLRLEHAELAILSACETTRPADRLPGEAIHVATAFQLAGFQQVIGTLWPVNDTVAGRFVDRVYSRLAAGARAGEDDVPVGAQAVHAATIALRERYRDHPSCWTQFVHAGR